MAVVNVQEKWSHINADITQATGNGALRWSAARAFTVLFSSDPSPVNAIAGPATGAGLPAIGDAYDGTYTFLKCMYKTAIPLGPLLFEVVCDYAGKDSPLLDAWERSGETVRSEVETDRDGDGGLLVNTAGDPVSGITRPHADQAYIYTRNEASEPDTIIQTYANRKNSDTWKTIWTAGTAWLSDIRYTRIVDGASYYWRVTYRIDCRADGWNFRYVSEGRRFVDGTGNLQSVKSRFPGLDTHLLDSDGTLLPPGDAPTWLTPPMFDSVAFAGLGLT